MCGLVGIAGDTNGNWKDIFNELLLIDTVRGPHSTGAAFVARADEDMEIVKAVGNPFNLFKEPEFERLIDKTYPKVIMGHNRFATIGEKTVDNAHPFLFDHTVGMHNGTLDKWVLPDLWQHDKYGTDSEAIISSINEWGIADTVKQMAGAWALIWFDKNTHTLNFLRNDKRPLYYCYSKDRKTMVWASEKEMLRYVMDRRKKDIFIPKEPANHDGLFPVTANLHYSWVIPKLVADKIDSPTQVERKGRSYTYQYSGPFKPGSKKSGHHSTQGVYSNNVHDIGPHLSKKERKQKLRDLARADPEKFRPPYRDMYGRNLTKPQFEAMIEEGCCFCGRCDLEWKDFAYVVGAWTGPKSTPFVCEDCVSDTSIEDVLNYAM